MKFTKLLSNGIYFVPDPIDPLLYEFSLSLFPLLPLPPGCFLAPPFLQTLPIHLLHSLQPAPEIPVLILNLTVLKLKLPA